MSDSAQQYPAPRRAGARAILQMGQGGSTSDTHHGLSATFLPSRPTDATCFTGVSATIHLPPAAIWSSTGDLKAWLLSSFKEVLDCCSFQRVSAPWEWRACIVRPGEHKAIPIEGGFLEAFHVYGKRTTSQRWLDVLLVYDTKDRSRRQFASFRVQCPCGSAAY